MIDRCALCKKKPVEYIDLGGHNNDNYWSPWCRGCQIKGHKTWADDLAGMVRDRSSMPGFASEFVALLYELPQELQTFDFATDALDHAEPCNGSGTVRTEVGE